jgi:hypothetical protein
MKAKRGEVFDHIVTDKFISLSLHRVLGVEAVTPMFTQKELLQI